MKTEKLNKCSGSIKKQILYLLFFTFSFQTFQAQVNETQFFAYNTLLGGVTGGIGALINKKKDQKWHKVLLKGFMIGCGGGAISYSGKKLNSMVSQKQELGYCWLSRAVFSAGNSIIENASSNKKFWSRWHYDVGFMRFELELENGASLMPKFMPSAFGGIIFMAVNGEFDGSTTLKSGTLTFRADQVNYANNLSASTASNGFLFINSLNKGHKFYDTYSHEMIHAFQFQEFSAINYFFNPIKAKWQLRSTRFENLNRWFYGDINFEAMLLNYFIIHKGYIDSPEGYCDNFLENEAEFLSVGKSACDFSN
ncbi:MAG TPA: hypothetical protein PKZ75_14065 [Bacteroidia bacterium]|nr:hypothetical protein [Bacteroidia bacterium]